MRTYIIKLCVVLLLLSAATAYEYVCPSACVCERVNYNHNPEDTNILCPVDYNTQRTKISQKKYFYYEYGRDRQFERISFNCSTAEPAVEDILAQMNITGINSAEYVKCQLPADASIGQREPNLQSLIFERIQFIAIEPLADKHFCGLSKLVGSNIKTNSSNKLPDDFFDRVPLLKSFSLLANNVNLTVARNLVELSDGRFGSYAGNLNTDLFANLPKFRLFHLLDSRLGRVTKESLAGLTTIKEIKLLNNAIESIDSDAIEHIVDMENFFFGNNGISNLPLGLFNQSKHLRYVSLYGQRFVSLPAGFLSNLPDLLEVTIQCDLPWVPDNLFTDSCKIETIDLSSNEFNSLPSHLFADQINLKRLDLSRNRLTSLPRNLCNNLQSLESLNLDHNQFRSVSDALLRGPPKLKELSMNNNLIEDISVADLKLIEADVIVDLRYNLIRGVSAGEYVQKESPRLPGSIRIGFNPFNCACEAEPFLQIIRRKLGENDYRFDASNLRCASPNHLNGQDVHFLKISDLGCEHLTFNYERPSPCRFSADEQKTTLIMNCSNAGLTEVPPIPTAEQTKYDSLELYIENSYIVRLPDVREYIHLKKIFAQNNSIRELKPVNIPAQLEALDISNNKLKFISYATAIQIQYHSALNSLKFDGNPWIFKHPFKLPDGQPKLEVHNRWN